MAGKVIGMYIDACDVGAHLQHTGPAECVAVTYFRGTQCRCDIRVTTAYHTQDLSLVDQPKRKTEQADEPRSDCLATDFNLDSTRKPLHPHHEGTITKLIR